MNNYCYESPSWFSDEENSLHFDSKSEGNVDSDGVDSDIEIQLYSHLQHSFENGLSSTNQNQNSFTNSSIPKNKLIDCMSIFTETSEGLQNGSVPDEHDNIYLSNNVLNIQVEKFAVEDSSLKKNSDSESHPRISKKKGLNKNGKKGKQTRIRKKASMKRETKESNVYMPHANETSDSDSSIICIESDSDLDNPGKLLSNLCYSTFIQKKRKKESFVEDNFLCIDSVSTSSDNSLTERISLFETPKLFSKASTLSSSTPMSTPQNGNLWHVDHDDFYSRGRQNQNQRYHEKQNSTCSRCKKKGHQANSCEEKREVKCYICGGDHPWVECNRQVCGRCYNDGHVSRYCQYSAREIHCYLCKMKGHLIKGCPDLWRRYHLTTSPDTIVRGTKVSDISAKYCYNCGRKGHFGHECPKPRMSSDSFPTWPFIVSYNDPKKILRRHSIGTTWERGGKGKRNSQGQYSDSPHTIPEIINNKIKKIKHKAEHKNHMIHHVKCKAERRIRIAQHMNGNGNMTYSEPYFPRTPTRKGDASGSKMKKNGEYWKQKKKQKFHGSM